MKKKPPVKTINLALQGGGAHGAFTWGVLDAILEDSRIKLDGITATSAGSVNAAVMVHGYAKGGPKAARKLLEEFWWKVSESGAVFSPVQRSPAEWTMGLNPFLRQWSLEHSTSYAAFAMLTQVLSPYQFNPLNFNPLREILTSFFDGHQPRVCKDVDLFLTATNVRTGAPHIFRGERITIDSILASAALPQIFQAVEIEGEYYWDGGYMGNPSLWPLFYHVRTPDILIVHVNPIHRAALPMDAYGIGSRLNEITFNSALLKELRAVAFVKKIIKRKMFKETHLREYRDILIHAIQADEVMGTLSIASKFDTSWPFLLHLRDLGRHSAQNWIDRNFEFIGIKDTVDLQKEYLTEQD